MFPSILRNVTISVKHLTSFCSFWKTYKWDMVAYLCHVTCTFILIPLCIPLQIQKWERNSTIVSPDLHPTLSCWLKISTVLPILSVQQFSVLLCIRTTLGWA